MATRAATEPSADGLSEAVALRDRLLATSWALLGVVEQLGAGEAQRLLAAEHQAAVAHAHERLPPLQRWPGLPERSYATYVGGNNHVRIARMLDFVEQGDRILDIGIGYGYLTSVLVRSGLPAYYCGIDLTERFVSTTRDGLRFLGLPDDHVHLEVGDVYDLTQAWVEPHDPTLVLLLEVLEHVSDAPRALSVLAAALKPGTSVMFTVPMMNRLEGVWGHRSLFDRRRLKELCPAAGLTIQYVEPLHNVWALVLATTTPEVPSRLLTMARAPSAPEPPSPPAHDYVFRDVSLDEPAESYQRRGRPQRGTSLLRTSTRGLHCRIRPGRDRPPYASGLAFGAAAPAVLRLQVEYDEPDGMQAMCIDGYDGDERVARWKWTLGRNRPMPGERVVHVLKPDISGGRFVRVGRIEAHRIERIEVYAELEPDARGAAFTLLRAAYVPNLRGP